MTKRFLALVTLLLTVTTAARAEDAWTNISNARDLVGLTTGNYKLATSIDVTNTVYLAGSNNKVVLDLNGNRLRYTGSDVQPVITVRAGNQLTLQNSGGVEYGELTGGKKGGILNNGTLIVDNVTISGNTADEGGAIYNNGGTVTLKNTVITNNTAKNGAAIYNKGGNVEITGGNINGNKYVESNAELVGAIYNADGQVTMTEATIDGNEMRAIANYDAQDGGSKATIIISGGAIRNHTQNTAKGAAIYNSFGDVILLGGAAISGNTATSQGGAIWNLGNVTIQEAAITGNQAPNGGAIANWWQQTGGNVQQGTILMQGGTISGNSSTTYGGGGIVNYGALTLEGGTVSGNTCAMNGGGIWVGENATLMVQGNPVVKGNTNSGGDNNLFLKTGVLIQVSGPLTEDADMRLTLEKTGGCKFTKNFLHHNPTSTRTADFFHLSGNRDISVNNGELWAMPVYTYKNLDESGEEKNVLAMKVSEVEGKDQEGVSLGDGSFVLDQNTTFSERLTIYGDVKLILHSGTLNAQKGICVPENASLNIYTVSGEGGKIVATGSAGNAGIGSNTGTISGNITIVGGTVEATGGDEAAGVGSGKDGQFKDIAVKGGTLTAKGGKGGAGIGNGVFGKDKVFAYNETYTTQKEDVKLYVYKSKISISGGTVEATGAGGGAGIGGGMSSTGDGFFLSQISISGGTVKATGALLEEGSTVGGGAGIGAGYRGSCYFFRYPQAIPMERYAEITISDEAVVEAVGATGAAGIGGGLQVGNVKDYASVQDPTACPAYEGGGANVVISGGTVTATAGAAEGIAYAPQAIGHGGCNVQSASERPKSGSLDIYDAAKVTDMSSNTMALTAQRVDAARDNSSVKVETCTEDHNKDYVVLDIDRHSLCQYCASNEPHEYWHGISCAKCSLYWLRGYYFSDDEPNTEILKNYDDQYAPDYPFDFKLSNYRVYKDGDWNTMCLPFRVDAAQQDFFKGATVAMMQNIGQDSFDSETGQLTLNFDITAIDGQSTFAIERDVPFLVRWDKAEDYDKSTQADGSNPYDPTAHLFLNVTLPNSKPGKVGGSFCVGDKECSIYFKGTFEPVSWTAEDRSVLFLGSNNTLYYPNGEADITLNAFRAYFELTGIKAGEFGEAPFVRSFTLNFFDESTGINNVQWSTLNGQRSMDNGQRSTDNGQRSTVNGQWSMDNGQWSTLDGRRLSGRPAAAGIYVRSGRKVVIK